jgi:hypothetical protein
VLPAAIWNCFLLTMKSQKKFNYPAAANLFPTVCCHDENQWREVLCAAVG